MELFELITYLKDAEDYIEFSFYKNSSDIMGAISREGIDNVLNIISMSEIKKGIFECVTTWEVDKNTYFNKNVIIDISGEMIYITESLENTNSSLLKSDTLPDIDFERDYSEILYLLKSKPLNRIEKDLLTKVVAAFFK